MTGMGMPNGYESFGGDGGGFGGGGGGTTGGGYMQSSSQMQGTPASQPADDFRKASTVTPVTIYQLQNATELNNALLIDGRSVSQVSIVGVIRTVDVRETKTEFGVEDHTGMISVTLWTTPSEEERISVRENLYVKVVGPPKTFNKRNVMTATQVFPITDYNEITHHLLSVIHTDLAVKKGPLNSFRTGGAGPMAGGAGAGAGAAAASAGGAFASTSHADNDGLSALDSDILNVIKECQLQQGMSVAEVCTALHGKHSETDIRTNLEMLSSEGHVYSTIDDEHFRSIDAS